jgi:hypothetical protein
VFEKHEDWLKSFDENDHGQSQSIGSTEHATQSLI